MLVFLVWLGVIVYVLTLGTRLVNAVEQIARLLADRPSDQRRPFSRMEPSRS